MSEDDQEQRFIAELMKNNPPPTVRAIEKAELLPIPVAVAFWCNVPPDEIESVLRRAFEWMREYPVNSEERVLRHPEIPCLAEKSWMLYEAIETKKIQAYSPNYHRIHPGFRLFYCWSLVKTMDFSPRALVFWL